MNKQTTRKGVACYAPAIAAGLMLAMAFTLSACGGDGGGGDEAPASSSSGNGSLFSSSSGGGSLSSSGSGSSSSGTSSSSSGGISSSSSYTPGCTAANNTQTQYCSNGTMKTYGSVTYEGQAYKTVVIGNQTWMAEDLSFNADGSRCYGDNTGGDSEGKCADYGRLYDWATAMGLEATCNSSDCSSQRQLKHQGVCPSGWHIPSNEDWDKLMRYADGTSGTDSPYDSETAGRYLKATIGWNSCGSSGSGSSYLCEDTHGFSALPGGFGYSDGSFGIAGIRVSWWSASEDDSDSAYGRYVGYNYGGAYYTSLDKDYLYSVRCVQD
ncbi:MAG: hypothetical protein LBH25_06270 [Fibromonadaceae bacterium]|jgi:uncharacterized protein (TIGR02145 family)|nr:hypothetical protein [Fibromonadaceae bacterium]